jgi:transcriptional regulator with XRE-family HTH domain
VRKNSDFMKKTMPRPKIIEADNERLLRCQHAIMIRAVRNGLGMSARELADLAGVHTTSILKAETNQTRIKPQTLDRIKEILRERGGHFMIGLNGTIHIEIDRYAIERLLQSPQSQSPQSQATQSQAPLSNEEAE